MAKPKRVKSGIPGLDKLIQGGFVENSVNLLTGETGTGKTTFGLQYIYHGLKNGEPGVYITLEENPDDIRSDGEQFGWELSKYEEKNKFNLIYHDPVQINNIDSVIIGEINDINAQRLVIDSTSLMGLNIENPAQIRRRIFSIINTIKRNECTALIITEIPENSDQLSRFGVEEFVTDSVIVLHYLGIGEVSARSLTVRKMRKTDHGNDVYPMEITEKGLVVKEAGI